MDKEKPWPPAYTVRRSKKARRVALRVSDARGLELVLPEKARVADIPALLGGHRAWIERQLARREARLHRRDALQPVSPFAPPAGFLLHGGELRVDLALGRGLGGAAMHELLAATPPGGAVVWPLPSGPEPELLRRLNVYIKSYARLYLAARLREIARRSGLGYGRVGFATQKSRWGSYAPDGTIRLNHKLIFLPPDLAENVILHELCHGPHPDHGPGFWALMREKDSEYAEKNKNLNDAAIWIPAWFS